MPEMDGFQLARAVKGDESIRDTVLIVLTSMGCELDSTTFHDLGLAGYPAQANSPIPSARLDRRCHLGRRDGHGLALEAGGKNHAHAFAQPRARARG